MSTHDTRRDERFELRPGSSYVEFPEGWTAALISISTSGLRLRVDGVPPDVGVGSPVR